jgi:hypothetical protein
MLKEFDNQSHPPQEELSLDVFDDAERRDLPMKILVSFVDYEALYASMDGFGSSNAFGGITIEYDKFSKS